MNKYQHTGAQSDFLNGHARRRQIVLIGLMACMATLLGRALDLQVLDRKDFLQSQGKIRHVAVVSIPAHRGRILDRNGYPLAISTQVESLWVNPQIFGNDSNDLKRLSQILEMPESQIRRKIEEHSDRQFVYVKRRIDPTKVTAIKKLGVAGLYFEHEFRRYYPAGEVTSHLLGFTDIDDAGQEGIELAFNSWLKGTYGSKRVIRDGKKRIIEDLENIKSPTPGNDLVLSIDQRLQYLAYRELKSAVNKHRAKSGSLVLIDSLSGEVLAMVNQPSFNPNSRKNLTAGRYRNRVITDVFEPGSTIKPFAIACALEAGVLQRNTIIDTRPGVLRVGRNIVRDFRNYGVLDVTQVLQKSSNVGVTKLALSLSPEQLWQCYNALGFAHPPGTGFPGEAAGTLSDFSRWGQFQQATISFGYGVSVSALQLAHAYSTLANDGISMAITLLKEEQDLTGTRIVSRNTARTVKHMLETVISREGTAWSARIPGYRVAGKTGTVKKPIEGGYSDDKYISMFAGMAPVSNPRLVTVVVIEEPSEGEYYGGAVAAPVFSEVMSVSLRMFGLSPDQQQGIPLLLAGQGEAVR